VPVNLQQCRHVNMRSKLQRTCTHPDHNVIHFHVTLDGGVAPLHQPFYHKFGVGIGNAPCAADEGDADTCRKSGKGRGVGLLMTKTHKGGQHDSDKIKARCEPTALPRLTLPPLPFPLLLLLLLLPGIAARMSCTT
jgi:hypothetical protein